MNNAVVQQMSLVVPMATMFLCKLLNVFLQSQVLIHSECFPCDLVS